MVTRAGPLPMRIDSKRAKVLQTLALAARLGTVAPTQREIGAALGINHATVSNHIQRLVADGRIKVVSRHAPDMMQYEVVGVGTTKEDPRWTAKSSSTPKRRRERRPKPPA